MTRLTVAVASGKGGTGKTLVATNLAAHLADQGFRVALGDCDVEAPNDHLFLPCATELGLVEVAVPEAPVEACPAGCTACRDVCRFGAIRMLGGSPVVFEDLCHNCGACVDACPGRVLREVTIPVGHTSAGSPRVGLRLVTGTLDIGQSKAPAVIGATRELAGRQDADIVILDSPPGAACSAVAALHGVDYLVLFTEPTAFGLHDLILMVDLAKELSLPTAVVLNRMGTGKVDIEGFCRDERIPIVSRIPFDRQAAECYANGELLVDAHRFGRDWFEELWQRLSAHLPAQLPRMQA